MMIPLIEAVDKAFRKVDPSGTCKNSAMEGALILWDKRNGFKFSEASEQESAKEWAAEGRKEIREELRTNNTRKTSQLKRDGAAKAKAEETHEPPPQAAFKRPAAQQSQHGLKKRACPAEAETAQPPEPAAAPPVAAVAPPAPIRAIAAGGKIFQLEAGLDEATINAIIKATQQAQTLKVNGAVVSSPPSGKLPRSPKPTHKKAKAEESDEEEDEEDGGEGDDESSSDDESQLIPDNPSKPVKAKGITIVSARHRQYNRPHHEVISIPIHMHTASRCEYAFICLSFFLSQY